MFLRNHPALLKIIEGNIGALGATILTVFPFMLAIYFTVWVSDSLAIARTIWGVFFLYYLYISLFIIDVSMYKGGTGWFVVAFIASLVLFIFMPSIRKGFWEVKKGSRIEKLLHKQDKRKISRKLTEGEYEDTIGMQ